MRIFPKLEFTISKLFIIFHFSWCFPYLSSINKVISCLTTPLRGNVKYLIIFFFYKMLQWPYSIKKYMTYVNSRVNPKYLYAN